MRIEPGQSGVSIWSPEIFGSTEATRIQEFLSRTFAVTEVESVELQRATHFGRIRYASAASPRQIWKKLSRALTSVSDAPAGAETESGVVRRIDAGSLYLESPGPRPIHVSRVGTSLSTWRVRRQSENTLHLWHPVLRNRRDVVFRLEEELATILGVEDFRASALTADVAIRFDKTALTIERLAGELEKAWPRLLDGLDGPPSRKRLIVAGGLLALAYTGQYLVPALRPLAVAGVALYSLPNVVKGVKQLARGKVGVYAVYSAGFGFLLVSGLPFASAAITVLMQLWPRLARRKFVSTQRRIFARQRRRQVWARKAEGDGGEIEVSADDLREGDVVIVRAGETVPIDGGVHDGFASVVESAPFSGNQIEQKGPGDWIGAGTFVRNGSLTIRVERTGSQTSARYLASLLPHSPLPAMPSLVDVENIADRNAKPTLALSLLTLGLTRTLRPAQAVIRPDYVTAPRLSAQLSALQGLGEGARKGIFFRNPAALDRLARAEVYLFDDTAGLERRRLEVAAVQAAKGFTEAVIADYALAAREQTGTEQSSALVAFVVASNAPGAHPEVEPPRHGAGVTRYRDSGGHTIEVATAQYVAALKIELPSGLRRELAQQTKTSEPRKRIGARDHESSPRSLWVLKDGHVIGVVSFARTGEKVGQQAVAAIKEQNARARIAYLSRGGEAEARALADVLGIEFSFGGLDSSSKADLIRGAGRPTAWVGNGSDDGVREAIAASTVSVSIAPSRHSPQDVADILLPLKGLDSLAEVIAISQAHESRLARDYRTVYAANLLGVGGAYLARFNALRSGLVSNIGTGLVYARHAKALDRLAAGDPD